MVENVKDLWKRLSMIVYINGSVYPAPDLWIHYFYASIFDFEAEASIPVPYLPDFAKYRWVKRVPEGSKIQVNFQIYKSSYLQIS